MSLVRIPENCGKVRVMMALGNRYAVWNGKKGWRHELMILCRNKKHAQEIADMINNKTHNGEIEITG